MHITLPDLQQIVCERRAVFSKHAIQTPLHVLIIRVIGVRSDVELQFPAFAGRDVGQFTRECREQWPGALGSCDLDREVVVALG